MTVIAAVTDNRQGHLALVQAITEAERFGTDVVAVNLANTTLDLTGIDTRGVTVQVVDRRAKDNQDSADVILDEITAREATRLVIGIKRRTPVGKAILGSMSQTLLLNAPIPVLAVKLPEDEIPSSFFDNLPGGMHNVTS